MADPQIAHLVKLSRLMHWLCWFFVFVVISASLFTGASWLFDRAAISEQFSAIAFSPDKISTTASLMIIAVNGVTVFFTCKGLIALANLFGALQRKEVLTRHSTNQLRSAGFSFLIVAIYGIAARTISILILTYGNAAGERQLAIGLGTNELFTILMAGTFFVIGHVLSIAASIEEENKGFV